MTAWNIIAAVLSLAGLAWSQTDPPPPAILKGNPPGGLGAHCTAPSLTGYLNSSGVLILCPSGTSVWTAQRWRIGAAGSLVAAISRSPA